MDWKFEEGRVYSTDEKGELLAEATFVRKNNGEVDIDHTYVSPLLRGQGVAGKMMAVVAGYFREKGVKTTASCSYAHDWLQKNREAYADIISAGLEEMNPACKVDGRH